MSDVRARHLVDLYGTKAKDVALNCQSIGEDGPLVPGGPFTRNEIRLMLRREYAETLSDILLRRSPLAITGAVSMELVDALIPVIAQERGLSPAQMAAQKTAFIAELEDFHGVSANTLMARNKEGRPICA